MAAMSTAARRPGREGEHSLPAELALAALTVSAVISFGRLFDTGRFFGPVFLAAVGSHLVARAARRLGLGLAAAAALSLVAGALAVVWLVEPSTTTYGIPGVASWQAVAEDLRDAYQRFGDVVAPTPSTEGFVAAAVIGTWVAAFLADAAAFRLVATFEAIIPSLTLFIFSSALGPDRHRVIYTVVYLAGVLGFVLVRTATRRAETTSWFAGRRGGGAATIAQGGVGLAVTGVVVAALVGPALPGADNDALVPWRGQGRGDGPRDRFVPSPLVDTVGRLVRQSQDELFTVKTPDATPSYWRLTALEEFNGEIWLSKNSYQDATGLLPRGEPSAAREETLVQEFRIGPLSSTWLPAAVRPERLSQRDARYDKESGSLLAASATSNGLRYTVTSKLPRPVTDELSAAGNDVPREIGERYLALPQDFPPRVVQEAKRVTEGARTPYAKALALQQHFRSPSFVYTLEVEGGHDGKAMVDFLFNTRAGYCEIYAGTYAAMARAVGLPSRVAVGFTPGLLRNGVFHVRGADYHAWPEVYVAGYGWVAFEPTPGRSQPGTEAYARTPPFEVLTETGPRETVPTSPPTTASAPADRSARNPEDVNAGTGAPGSRERSNWERVRGAIGRAFPFVAVALVLLTVAVPGLRELLRRRRRRAATTPSARVMLAWEEAEALLASTAGLPRRPSETPLEYAARVVAAASVDDAAMNALAHRTLAAGFSATGVDDEAALAAETAGADMRRVLLGRLSKPQLVRWAVDPRTLVRRERYSSGLKRRRMRLPASPK
jgi:transglutaminase-like putative cysteine protease